MKTHSLLVKLGVFALLLGNLSRVVMAQTVPPLINYQGKLVSSNGLPMSTGDYELRFRIWDTATGGTLIWGPQVFNGQTGPGYGSKVPVLQGWFNVMLGPVDTNGIAIANAFTGANRFLEIQLGTNAPFNARQQILSTPFALKAGSAESATRANVAESVPSLLSSSNMTLYVSPSGADSNDGLTALNPKQTIQAALDSVPRGIEHYVTIQLSPGVYTNAVNIIRRRGLGELARPSSSCQLRIFGTTPAEVFIRGLVTILESQVEWRNSTFDEPTQAVSVANWSLLNLVGCNFRTRLGLTVVGMSMADLYGCNFTGSATNGTGGLMLQRSSYATLQATTFANFETGVGAYFGSTVTLLDFPVYSNNVVDHVEKNGSHYGHWNQP